MIESSGESVTRSRTMCYKKKAVEKHKNFFIGGKKVQQTTEETIASGRGENGRGHREKLIGGRIADAT
jgi:hypothetical protein